MKRKYYALYNCDAWKSSSSMGLVGIFSESKLKRLIKKRIKQGKYEFGRDIKEFNEMNPREIDISLEYGCIESLSLNEIID